MLCFCIKKTKKQYFCALRHQELMINQKLVMLTFSPGGATRFVFMNELVWCNGRSHDVNIFICMWKVTNHESLHTLPRNRLLQNGGPKHTRGCHAAPCFKWFCNIYGTWKTISKTDEFWWWICISIKMETCGGPVVKSV